MNKCHGVALALTAALVMTAAGAALADVTGSDFDALPVGPYPFGGSPRFLEGADPGKVKVIPAPAVGGGAPIPPGAMGNVLCIDNIQPVPGTRMIVEFDFECEINPAGVCLLKYDFSGAAWVDGAGFDVFIDPEGEYDNTDATWSPPVVIAPSTIYGSNTEGTGVCNGSGHTVAFLVRPGAIMYIDNLRTECVEGTVGSRTSTWGAVKSIYRE